MVSDSGLGVVYHWVFCSSSYFTDVCRRMVQQKAILENNGIVLVGTDYYNIITLYLQCYWKLMAVWHVDL